MTPIAQLRAARNSFDLFAKLHPIIQHEPVFDEAMNNLAEAIDRLELAVERANTFSQTERIMP